MCDHQKPLCFTEWRSPGMSRELVVQAVMRGPPQRALLRGERRAEREHELEPARRLVAAVREVAVIRAGHEEHARHVQRERQREPDHDKPGDRDADDREDVDAPERDRERVEVDAAPAPGLRALRRRSRPSA